MKANIIYIKQEVTPRAGVRIETGFSPCVNCRHWESHPARVCGLKLVCSLRTLYGALVTPRAGVRIETAGWIAALICDGVTPRAGVRIET